jgi:hypothetical protein
VSSARHDDAKVVAISTRNSLGAMVDIFARRTIECVGVVVVGAFSMMLDGVGNRSREK